VGDRNKITIKDKKFVPSMHRSKNVKNERMG
jgi:hypothetical protein